MEFTCLKVHDFDAVVNWVVKKFERSIRGCHLVKPCEFECQTVVLGIHHINNLIKNALLQVFCSKLVNLVSRQPRYFRDP